MRQRETKIIQSVITHLYKTRASRLQRQAIVPSQININ